MVLVVLQGKACADWWAGGDVNTLPPDGVLEGLVKSKTSSLSMFIPFLLFCLYPESLSLYIL